MLTRVSARASGAPGQKVGAVPERKVLPRVRAADDDLVRVLELARVSVRGTVQDHHRGARRELDTADITGTRDRRKSLDRALGPAGSPR